MTSQDKMILEFGIWSNRGSDGKEGGSDGKEGGSDGGSRHFASTPRSAVKTPDRDVFDF